MQNLIDELSDLAALVSDHRAISLQLFFPAHQAIHDIVRGRTDDCQRSTQLVRDRGDKLHLQVGQLDRSKHLASLDGPNRGAGEDKRKGEDCEQPDREAARGSNHVGQALRSLLIVEPLDFFQVLTDTIERLHAPGDLDLLRRSRLTKIFDDSFVYKSISFSRLVRILNLEIAIIGG